MKTRTLISALGLMVLVSGMAIAQENLSTPTQAGAYDLFGTFKVGYRLVSVESGDQTGEWFKTNANNLFREQYNLADDDEFALGKQLPISLDLFGNRRDGQAGFFDQVFLNADINPTTAGGSLRMRKFDAYDLNLSYKHVDYFYDRYDSLYSDLRRYESNRNDLRASLDITATEFLGVALEYHGVGHGGNQEMVRPMFVEGGPEGADRIFFNAYRNYYLMDLPRTDFNSEFSGKVKADLDMVSVAVGGGYMSYTEDFALTPLAADSLPLNYRSSDSTRGYANSYGIVGDNRAAERLHRFSHTEDRKMSGPFVFGQLILKPVEMLNVIADVRMDMLEGETSVATDQLAEVRRTAGSGASTRRYNLLYDAKYNGEIVNTLDRLNLSVAATVNPIPELDVTAGYKLASHEIDSKADYHLKFDTASIGSTNFQSHLGVGENATKHMEWHQITEQPVSTIFGSVGFSPMPELGITAGVRMISRKPDVQRSEHGELDSVVTINMSKESSGLGLDFGVNYRPMRELRLRARFENQTLEAEFAEDAFVGGPAAGTITDLEPRTTPEKKMRLSASVDYDFMPGLSAGVRFGMQKASADLNESMWVIEKAGGEKVELKDDNMTISGVVSYRINDNTVIRLMGESRTNDFSIPMTWTRGQEMPNPIFQHDPTQPPPSASYSDYDSATVIIAQKTDDIYFDLGVETKLIDALTIGAGFSYLAVTGVPTITPEVRVATGTPIVGLGDVTRQGDEFNRMIVNGNLQYDITSQFGVAVDVMYAIQDEKELLETGPSAASRNYGLNDYNGFSSAFSVVFNF